MPGILNSAVLGRHGVLLVLGLAALAGGAAHDAKGDRVRNERGYGFTYDFENRLTRVFTDSDLDGQYDVGEPVHEEYLVDPPGRRVLAGVAGVTTYRYYDGAVVLAEFDAVDPARPVACYFNGPNDLDEKLLIRGRAGAGGSAEFYVLLKDLYTVAGITDADGQLFEWYTYTGYGLPTIHGAGPLAGLLRLGDADGDCDVDLADFAGLQRFFSGSGNPYAPGGAVFDSDGDGDVDFADFQAFAANLNGPGSGLCASRVNPFGFTGQRVDVLAGGALVLYDYKARVYDPLHGRFQQRDPAEFLDGYNLYEYVASWPTALTDPMGTFTLAGISISTALSRGLQGLNAADAARRVLQSAKQLKAGISVQQILVGIIIDVAMDKLGGRLFDEAMPGLRGIGSIVKGKFDIHHPIPKFLGGDRLGQFFSKLKPGVHDAFHDQLRKELQERSLDLPIGGTAGSTEKWADLFTEGDPGAQAKALEAILAASDKIDAAYPGTNLVHDVWLNILGGKFTPYP